MDIPECPIFYPLSSVIPGMRSAAQAVANTGVSDLDPLPQAVIEQLREHAWLRGVWYGGK